MHSDQSLGVQAATHLLYQHHTADDGGWKNEQGTCCFCGHRGAGVSDDEAVSLEYFSDHDLMQAETGHVCAACAYCMNTRALKQGHWVAHGDGLRTPSTGDLRDCFQDLACGSIPLPLAVHVTGSPIRSSHAYLWTPVNSTQNPLTIAYDRQRVRIDDWDAFEELVAAIEDLRLHGFTFDELRSGEPRVRNVRSIGLDDYRRRDDVLAPYRHTARLDLALTLSRSSDDQSRTNCSGTHDPLSK